MQEQMRKLVEESHNKKSKKNKKKEFSDGSRATLSQTKKKKPSGEVKPVLMDSISASISNVVRCFLLPCLGNVIVEVGFGSPEVHLNLALLKWLWSKCSS